MLRWAALLALTFHCAITSAADEESHLKIGDPAPILHPMAWIKGEPVTHYDPGRIYVVEFWATWCPPCLESVPRLTALQSKYRDELTVVGVNVLESAMGRVMRLPSEPSSARAAPQWATQLRWTTR